MSATPHQTLDIFRTALAANLTGWTESQKRYEQYTLTSTPNGRTLDSQSWAAAVLRTDFPTISRQRGRSSTPATSVLGIRWAYRLRSDSPVTSDYSSALDAQVDMVKAARAAAESQGQQPRILSVSSTASPSGDILLGDLQLEVVHMYPLQ